MRMKGASHRWCHRVRRTGSAALHIGSSTGEESRRVRLIAKKFEAHANRKSTQIRGAESCTVKGEFLFAPECVRKDPPQCDA